MVDSSVNQSGRYKAYPEYKDSGVEWLSEIPSGWQVTPVKYLADLTPKKPNRTKDLLSKECSFIPMEKLKLDKLELDETKLISEVFDGYTYFENDDVLIAKVTPCFENKNMAVASNLRNGIGFGSSEIYVLRADKKAHNRYLFYRLQESVFMSIAISNMTGAGGLRRVPADTISNYSIAIPAKSEQEQISSFLDYETAKIDTLIEKQQRLIELLTEKRQAVISHAVTKGLNPDVPMKDSGVEWLGEVPEHWDVMRFTMTNEKALLGGNYNSSESEEGIPVIKMGNLGRGSIDINKVERLSENSSYEKEHILKKGDFLFNTRNSLALVGKVSIWREELDLAIYNSNVLKIDFNHYIGTTEYMNYLFNSDLGLSQLRLIAKGTTNVAAVYYKDLKDLIFAYPPAKEQFEVVKFLNVKCEAIDSLINLAHKQIQLMQERRTALISAAVTGKIDVRDWVKPE